MRTYGIVFASDGSGNYQWVEVDTDANGLNDAVMLTTLCQVLQLDRGESPVYGGYGVPLLESLQRQVPPDLYVAQTQAQFAPFFAALTVTRATATDGSPIYNITAVTNSGAILKTVAGQPVIPT